MNKYYDIEWCKPQRISLLGWRLRALGDQIQPKVRASGSLSVRKIMSISCSRLRMKLDMQSAHDALGRAPSSTWVGSFFFSPSPASPPLGDDWFPFVCFAVISEVTWTDKNLVRVTVSDEMKREASSSGRGERMPFIQFHLGNNAYASQFNKRNRNENVFMKWPGGIKKFTFRI